MRFPILATTLAACAICIPNAQAASADTALTNLIALTSQRLALAEPVAHWKWLKHAAITDPVREQALLTQVATQAVSHHVDPAFADLFFKDQIGASKEVQTMLFAQWDAGQPPQGAVPDLAATRPQLDALTRSLLAALAQVQPLRAAADCPSRLAVSLANWKNLTTFDTTRSSALAHALGHVCAAGGIGAVG